MSDAAVERTECPKCGADVAAEAPACTRCGLARARFAGFAASADADAPAALRELWSAVLADWDDRELHDRFLQAGLAARAFPYMARCYRTAARERGDDPIARERLDDIGRRAEAAILTAAAAARYREDEQEEPFKKVIIMMAVLIAVIAAGTAYAMLSGGGPGEF